jgi:UDP-N-acetylglucosamine 2-epimerase (non-hydrolysing)
MKTVLTLFGTRPEVIKLAPVIRELEALSDRFRIVNVTSAQHTDLLYPLTDAFRIRIHHDLRVMEASQSPAQVCARVLSSLEPIVAREAPDLILVQGDTTTAMAGALLGFYRQIPVGHVEAGLRSGNPKSPFPEEMNRRLVTKLATLHFAATSRNFRTLLEEGVPRSRVILTGNPVVDSLHEVLAAPSPASPAGLEPEKLRDRKLIVLTTHRRESFGEIMSGNLRVLRAFVERHDDVLLAFPVHPNPSVRQVSHSILGGHPRIHLLEPLEYVQFIHLLAKAWLIVSDSGGVQEEAPTLGKPLLILRENTERPEAVDSGVARLVGGNPETLATMLEELHPAHPWLQEVCEIDNPFGQGDAGYRIVDGIARYFGEGEAAREIPAHRQTGKEIAS